MFAKRGVCKMWCLQNAKITKGNLHPQADVYHANVVRCHVLCVDAPVLALGENVSNKVQVEETGGRDGEFNLLGLFVFLPAFHRSIFLPCTWLCVSDPVCPVFVRLPLLPMVSRCFHSSPFV